LDEKKGETRVPISHPHDIYSFEEKLIEKIGQYEPSS